MAIFYASNCMYKIFECVVYKICTTDISREVETIADVYLVIAEPKRVIGKTKPTHFNMAILNGKQQLH
ncbi:MAG: hypothetical protein LBC12_07890 [Nitrososphaerota archaeon]|jgi:hypothetical protein|nr:hypothetical protein [Nitrososphaerota archaeon]